MAVKITSCRGRLGGSDLVVACFPGQWIWPGFFPLL